VAVEILFSRIQAARTSLPASWIACAAVENLLMFLRRNCPVTTQASKRSALAMVGTSMLRRILQRSAYAPDYAEQMGAVMLLREELSISPPI